MINKYYFTYFYKNYLLIVSYKQSDDNEDITYENNEIETDNLNKIQWTKEYWSTSKKDIEERLVYSTYNIIHQIIDNSTNK